MRIKGLDLIEKKLGAAASGFVRGTEEIFSSALKRLVPLPEADMEAEISLSFVKDEEMKDLNRKYRGIDSSTDILSFPLWEEEGEFAPPEGWDPIPLGDLIISPEKVAENAADAGINFENELVTVLSHGLLHLIGFDHSDPEEERLMWAEQDKMTEDFFSGKREGGRALSDICFDAENLLSEAANALSNAYAPYSSFRVGAAILFRDGSVITGCNVENVSLGLSICAERNAMTTAVALGKLDPIAIAVSGADGVSCPPCGACRQFLSEFNDEMSVVFEKEGKTLVYSLDELLPVRFKFRPEVGRK